ncbi:MAG: di-heme oxidoredictase family protein [Acidobacteriota bacterium]
MNRLKMVILGVVLLSVPLAYAGAEQQLEKAHQPAAAIETAFGDPLPGLDSDELGRFRSGRFEFERRHTVEEGLGPNFNEVSCVACHSVPTTGGSLENKRDLVVRIGRTLNGKYDPLTDSGGQVLSRQSITTFGLSNCRQPGNAIPAEAEFVSFRMGQPLFGLGLIDSINEATILANADPTDQNGDGISGRANMVISASTKNIAVGRFGWKAQMTSLLDFCSDSYVVENGITNPIFPTERRPNGKDPKCDGAPDPEDDGRVIHAFTDYITFLAPPPTKPLDSIATQGKQIFSTIGCTACHIPVLRTSGNPAGGPVLASRDVALYSDLLLHDMGDDLADGIEQPVVEFLPTGQKPSTGREWRTQPLWGISAKKFLLHDGRTTDLTTAIILHGGEADGARRRFLKLKVRDRDALLSFLKTL